MLLSSSLLFSSPSVPPPDPSPSGDLGEVLAILRALGPDQVVLRSPVTRTGDIHLVRGSDYYASEGRAIRLPLADSLAWKHRVARVAWKIVPGGEKPSASVTLEVEGAWNAAAGVAQIELSRSDTALFKAGPTYAFELDITLQGEDERVIKYRGALTAE